MDEMELFGLEVGIRGMVKELGKEVLVSNLDKVNMVALVIFMGQGAYGGHGGHLEGGFLERSLGEIGSSSCRSTPLHAKA